MVVDFFFFDLISAKPNFYFLLKARPEHALPGGIEREKITSILIVTIFGDATLNYFTQNLSANKFVIWNTSLLHFVCCLLLIVFYTVTSSSDCGVGSSMFMSLSSVYFTPKVSLFNSFWMCAFCSAQPWLLINDWLH